jgi:hypothetical protein
MSAEEVIPEHNEGMQTNTESSVELSTEQEAKNFFNTVKDRLFNVSNWHQYGGTGTAGFQLTDEHGKTVSRIPKKGDHFKIDIPGPGSVTGEGNDWVKVEEILEEENCVAVRVRPSTNPTNDRSDVAHFFKDSATSSFIVKREGKKITAGVYGRNEKPNTKTETVVDKIRNVFVGSGAITGFSKLQWKSLVNGLVKKD